jgi:hypothetical protein
MEMIECGRKDNIMKGKYYTHHFKQLNELIKEQKSIKEKERQNNMVDTVIIHEHTPRGASRGTRL